MRFYLISDNADTLVGMRLAGIDGELVHDAQSVEDAVNRCLADEEVGIILITRPLCELCGDFITQTKRSYDKPLIVEIPEERLHRALCARHYRHKDLRCLTNAQSGRKSRKVF